MVQDSRALIDYGSEIQRERKTRILRNVLRRKRLSRAELTDLTGLSQSSVIKYVKSLREEGILREVALHDSRSGRKTTGLEFDPGLGLSIAIVLSANNLSAYLVDPIGAVLAEHCSRIYQRIPRENLLDQIVHVARTLKEEASHRMGKHVFGIGVGLGGFLDPNVGVSHQYLFSTNWAEVPLPEIVGARLDLPTFIVNDTNAVALGEMLFGGATDAGNCMSVWLGEGVGMGIAINGEVYEGSNGYVGEIGHTKAVEDGELCYCGHRGCLETVASESYVLQQFRNGLAKGVHTRVFHPGATERELSIGDLILAANEGDRFVRNIFTDVARHLALKIADVANVLNPDRIVFRGPTIDNNRYLYTRLSQELEANTLQPIWDSMRVSFYEGDEDHIQARGLGSYVLLRYFG